MSGIQMKADLIKIRIGYLFLIESIHYMSLWLM